MPNSRDNSRSCHCHAELRLGHRLISRAHCRLLCMVERGVVCVLFLIRLACCGAFPEKASQSTSDGVERQDCSSGQASVCCSALRLQGQLSATMKNHMVLSSESVVLGVRTGSSLVEGRERQMTLSRFWCDASFS